MEKIMFPAWAKKVSPDTDKIEPYVHLDDDHIYIQNFWIPKIGDQMDYAGHVTSIRSMDKKYPEQATILNENENEEIAFLQDCAWLFTRKDLDQLLSNFGLTVTEVGMRINGVKGFFQRPETLDNYVECIRKARHMSMLKGKKDPIENWSDR